MKHKPKGDEGPFSKYRAKQRVSNRVEVQKDVPEILPTSGRKDFAIFFIPARRIGTLGFITLSLLKSDSQLWLPQTSPPFTQEGLPVNREEMIAKISKRIGEPLGEITLVKRDPTRNLGHRITYLVDEARNPDFDLPVRWKRQTHLLVWSPFVSSSYEKLPNVQKSAFVAAVTALAKKDRDFTKEHYQFLEYLDLQ